MTRFGAILIFVGFMLLAGSVGRHDFWEECLAAADCVAGDPPSMIVTMVLSVIGLLSMAAGVILLNSEDEYNA